MIKEELKEILNDLYTHNQLMIIEWRKIQEEADQYNSKVDKVNAYILSEERDEEMSNEVRAYFQKGELLQKKAAALQEQDEEYYTKLIENYC